MRRPQLNVQVSFFIQAWLKKAILFGVLGTFLAACGTHDQSFKLNSIQAVDLQQYYRETEQQTGQQDFRQYLHKIISTAKVLGYGALIHELPYTDEDPQNPGQMRMIYSRRLVSTVNQDISWNREHVWPQSHGVQGPAKSDLHHVRPCENHVNSTRGDKDFGELNHMGEEVQGAPGTYVSNDRELIEPLDEVKGDIARMLFYMAIRYEGSEGGAMDLELVNQEGTRRPHLGRLDALLKWHEQDPVDAAEKQRNDRIYERQENRNPFIDHPEWVARIWTP